MIKSNKSNFLNIAILSVIGVNFALTPAKALPGQNIQTVLRWVKTSPLLPAKLEYGHETLTYYGTKKNLTLHVTVDQQIVSSEGISVDGESKIKFTRKNSPAVKLLHDIYGSQIANDFKNARQVTTIADHQFYRGRRFAYITFDLAGTADAPTSNSSLKIIPLNRLQTEINSAKYCQTNQCDI